MGPQLLPASAAAFAPRATHVSVVLGSQIEPWLTQLFRRIGREKLSQNNVIKHQKYLSELFSSSTAIWTLSSLMVSRAPDFELHSDPNLLIEALMNCHILHIEGYIVHVDMALEHEIVFKLTPESIKALVNYHEGIYCANISTSIMFPWPGTDAQIKKLHADFVQSINKFVYRTNVTALDGIQEDGAGELLSGKSEQVKRNIMSLFHPLERPSRCKLDLIYPEVMNPNSSDFSNWIPQTSSYSVKLEHTEGHKLVLSAGTTPSSDSESRRPILEPGEIQHSLQFPALSPRHLSERFYDPLQIEASIPPTLHSCATLEGQQNNIYVEYGIKNLNGN